MAKRASYWSRLLAAISQFINVAVFNGDEDEMVCSRAYRLKWATMQWCLDLVFGQGHCKECFQWERSHYNVDRFK